MLTATYPAARVSVARIGGVIGIGLSFPPAEAGGQPRRMAQVLRDGFPTGEWDLRALIAWADEQLSPEARLSLRDARRAKLIERFRRER